MESASSNRAHAIELGKLLSAYQGIDTTVIDLTGQSSFTDYFVITTVRSTAHLQGLVRRIGEYVDQVDLDVLGNLKRPGESGWHLIDCGALIIHLMTKEMREFYELEKVWFEAEQISIEEQGLQ